LTPTSAVTSSAIPPLGDCVEVVAFPLFDATQGISMGD
jgi:hypothetical protein